MNDPATSATHRRPRYHHQRAPVPRVWRVPDSRRIVGRCRSHGIDVRSSASLGALEPGGRQGPPADEMRIGVHRRRATGVQSASANTLLPRRGFAAGHRRRGNRPRVKGGGQPFAALAVGSRAVGKRKTLSEMLRGTKNGLLAFSCDVTNGLYLAPCMAKRAFQPSMSGLRANPHRHDRYVDRNR